MRRVAIGLGALLVLLVALAALAVVFRAGLTAVVLRYGLSQAGFADARFDVERLDRRGLVVARVESGAELRVERCEIDFDWRRLPILPIDRIRVVSLRFDATGRTVAAPRRAPAWPLPLRVVAAIELDDAVVKIPSPVGPITIHIDSRVVPGSDAWSVHVDGSTEGELASATFSGDARLAEGGRVFMTVNMSAVEIRDRRARVAGGSAAAVIEGNSVGLALRSAAGALDFAAPQVFLGETEIGAVVARISANLARESGAWTAEITDADVRLPDQSLHASGISGEVSAGSAKLLVSRLEDAATAARFRPISIDLSVTETRPVLKLTADVATASGRATLHIEGRYDQAHGAALAELTLQRLMLDPKRLRPSDVSPLFAAASEASGAIEGGAHLYWTSPKGVSGDARLIFDNVSLSSPRVRIDGLDGEVKLREISPPETTGVQTLFARQIDPGVRLSDATLRWALEPMKERRGSRLRIDRFQTGFADGKITVTDAVLDPYAATNTIVFHLEALDLAKLFAIAGLKGVGGSGQLSGAIPVAVRSGAVAIAGGELAATGGVVQLRSEQVASLLSGGGESVELLLDALRDFHYDELRVTVEKAFEGEAAVRVQLAGANPAVMSGHPFRINLNLTGNLDRLLASLLEIARLSDRTVRATVRALQPGTHE